MLSIINIIKILSEHLRFCRAKQLPLKPCFVVVIASLNNEAQFLEIQVEQSAGALIIKIDSENLKIYSSCMRGCLKWKNPFSIKQHIRSFKSWNCTNTEFALLPQLVLHHFADEHFRA